MADAINTRHSMSPEISSWLTEELRWPVMATLKSDGMPSLSVIWFDLADEPGTILLNTRRGRFKEHHLRRDPRLSLCFEDKNDYVTLEGRAELIDDDDRGLADIQALARRYDSDPGEFEGQHRITILMRVERVIRHR
ncbi:MAG TPA: PPOX class F420-dependent oxidoreductase [Candidatus Limnocylindria bacterium]|jgi:PPOX class probable F420-dependent enzyme|nr:PPOX class F420-dependent oxidoreductase [Candidatus Limnocylindria bacterium]